MLKKYQTNISRYFFISKDVLYLGMIKEKKHDAFPLKLNPELGAFIRKLAKFNRRKINEELTIAIEEYRDRNKSKVK